jgi:hypothetical protein
MAARRLRASCKDGSHDYRTVSPKQSSSDHSDDASMGKYRTVLRVPTSAATTTTIATASASAIYSTDFSTTITAATTAT